MKKVFILIIVFLSFSQNVYADFILSSPYTSKSNVYKGQLHCHSTNSDGAQSPADLVTAYKDAGYNFISIQDHDVATADPGVSGITFIQGEERSANIYGHLGRINVSSHHTSNNTQTVITDTINAGAIARVNHPGRDWSQTELDSVTGITGMEIYNSKDVGLYDEVARVNATLSSTKRFYLFASDDCHNVTKAANFNKGWINVFADVNNSSSILSEIFTGNFYASCGASITSIEVSGKTITIYLPASSNVTWLSNGGTQEEVDSATTTAAYTASGDEVYIRAVVELAADTDQKAWINPIWIQETADATETRMNNSFLRNFYIN